MPDYSIDPDIARAATLPSAFYTDKQLFEQSKETFFAASWQFIGSSSLVRQEGDLYPFTLLERFLDEPLLLTRNRSQELHLLSNVCTHRGNLLASHPCQVSNIRCRYHGRTFDLNGKMLSMPEFREVENFPSPADDLSALPVFAWGKWLFTTLGKQFAPEVFLKDMMERVSWMPLEDFVFRPELSRTFHVKAHWALYCENYLEGFHIPFVHAGLNSVIDFGEYATELFFPYSSLQLGLAKKKEDCFDLPVSSPDCGKHVAAYYFWIFPNTMFNFYPWGLSVNVVEPLSVDETRVRFYSYVWDDTKLDKGAGAGLDKVEMEDEEIVGQVQRGIRSRFYHRGRYSVNREQGTHHFHRILSAFLNK